jgi:hypothetical protein
MDRKCTMIPWSFCECQIESGHYPHSGWLSRFITFHYYLNPGLCQVAKCLGGLPSANRYKLLVPYLPRMVPPRYLRVIFPNAK